ncbi:hypothetical protein [Kaarinaea lacus]
MSKLSASISLLIILAFITRPISAQEAIPGLGSISLTDIRQSAIAFVNLTTSPGLEGATIDLDRDNRQSTSWRSSLGFSAEVTLRNHIFDGYWGLAVVGGELKDKFEVVGDQGQIVKIDLRRQVAAIRGSLGLSFPVNQNFKLHPYLTLVASDLRSNASFENLPGTVPGDVFNSSAWMYSTVGTIDALYFQWYGQKKLELKTEYHIIYTDSFSEDNPYLATYDWNDAVKIEAKFSGPTKLNMQGRPWRWHGYGNFTHFLSHNEVSLGYTRLYEVGAGLSWQMNVKPLDWFGWQSLGIRLGVIFGEDVEGFNFGLTAQ